MYVWPDDVSLTEPKHVATLEATLQSVMLNGYCCAICCDILQHNWMENIKIFIVLMEAAVNHIHLYPWYNNTNWSYITRCPIILPVIHTDK
jgi:hypothetical protein